MQRIAFAFAVMSLIIASPASSSGAKGNPDGQYKGTNSSGHLVGLTVNRDGRRLQRFSTQVDTTCIVNGSNSSVYFAQPGKSGAKVSGKGRFSMTLHFKDVHALQGYSNEGEVVVSGKLKGKRVSGHLEGSGPVCSFSADFTATR